MVNRGNRGATAPYLEKVIFRKYQIVLLKKTEVPPGAGLKVGIFD